MAYKIDTVGSRNNLTPRREPYWHRIRTGIYLGFRKVSGDTVGSWLLRCRDAGTSTQRWHVLGAFDEVPAHQRFDHALTAAQRLLSQPPPTLPPPPPPAEPIQKQHTVLDTCTRYVDHVRTERGDTAADELAARFQRWIAPDPIASIRLDLLSQDHVRAFRKRVKDKPVTPKYLDQHPRSLDTVNRDLAPLRAALNHALDDKLVATDHAWAVPLRAYKNVTQRRMVYLDLNQRMQLAAHAKPDIAQFIQGLAMLPMRPGALAALTVANHQPRLHALNVGKDKNGATRTLPLPPALNDFLRRLAEGRLAEEPLFIRECGIAWDKDAWKKPVKKAVAKAGLSADTVLYTLRHSAITDMVCAGADLLTVAKLSGTSVAMIEKHYGHLRNKVATAALSTLLLYSSDRPTIDDDQAP